MLGIADHTRARRPGPNPRAGSWPGALALAAGLVLWLPGPPLAAQGTPSGSPAAAALQGSAGARDATRASSDEQATFQVIIHADNPTVEMEAARISRIFRKKVKRWDHDVRILPVDLYLKSPVRKAFTGSVHGKSVTAIHSLWTRMIFAGTDIPPDEKASEEEVVDFVRVNPGAIGYVAGDVELPSGVKELKITP